jgi:hypothetical protein
MRRRLVALGLLVVLAAMPRPGVSEPEEPPVPVITLDALPLSIPTDELPDPARARAEAVLARSAFAQRVSGIRFPSREPVYLFLLDHPDFAASVARALRVGEYRVTPFEDGYRGDDNRGATGTIRVLYADDHRRLYHLQGRYDHRYLPTIEGQLLILLEYHHETTETGATVVEQALTGHVRIDTPLLGGLADVLAALSRPLIEREAERKVRRFFGTVARVCRWAYEEPDQLLAALDGNPEVEPGPALTAFRELLLADRPPAWAQASFRLVDSALQGDDGP